MPRGESKEEFKLTTVPIIELKVNRASRVERKTKFIGLVTPFIDSEEAVLIDDLERILGVKASSLRDYAREDGFRMRFKTHNDGQLYAVFTKK